MHDFDVERAEGKVTDRAEREFMLGGQVFVHKVAVRPEAMTEWEDMPDDVTAADALLITDKTVLAFIEDDGDAHARYRAVRENEDDPLTVTDIGKVLVWLIGKATGRPTGARLLSTAGRAATKVATPSTDDLPLPVAALTG